MKKDIEDQRLVLEDEKKAPRIKKSLCKLSRLFAILPFLDLNRWSEMRLKLMRARRRRRS